MRLLFFLCLCCCSTWVWAEESRKHPFLHQVAAVSNYSQSLLAGEFANQELYIKLQALTHSEYQGEIRFNQSSYPLRAYLQDERLRGQFYDQGHGFEFSAWLENSNLWLETGGKRFLLPKRSAHTQANPLVGQSPANYGAEQTLWPQQPENMLAAHRSLNSQINHDFQVFMGGVRQWLSGQMQAEQIRQLVISELIPTALSLRHKLTQLALLSSRMEGAMQLSSTESQLMQQFITLGNKGSRFFEQWYLLLDQLLNLYDTAQEEALYGLARERLPHALKNSGAFARNFVLLVKTADAIRYRPLAPDERLSAGQYPSLNPKQILKWETFRNMSQMMREIMQILNGKH